MPVPGQNGICFPPVSTQVMRQTGSGQGIFRGQAPGPAVGYNFNKPGHDCPKPLTAWNRIGFARSA